MSPDTITPRIELLQEQIDNLEKSGFFTEKEMDKLCFPLREELVGLKRRLQDPWGDTAQHYGLTAEQMVEGRGIFIEIWKQLDNFINPVYEIEVTDAEILTPNHITA